MLTGHFAGTYSCGETEYTADMKNRIKQNIIAQTPISLFPWTKKKHERIIRRVRALSILFERLTMAHLLPNNDTTWNLLPSSQTHNRLYSLTRWMLLWHHLFPSAMRTIYCAVESTYLLHFSMQRNVQIFFVRLHKAHGIVCATARYYDCKMYEF